MPSLDRALAERGEYLERLSGDTLLALLYDALDRIEELLNDHRADLATITDLRTQLGATLGELARLRDQLEFDRGFNEAAT